MGKPLRVLLVEDSEDDAALLFKELQKGGYELALERVETVEAMKAALSGKTWDIIFSDFNLPQFGATAALEILKESGLDIPFIIISGTIGEETAVASLKAGADDFILKGKLARLIPALERELEQTEVRRQKREAEEALKKSEEQFRQSQKLEAVGRLAGGIAHDFNNLLTAMLGYADVLHKGFEPQDPRIQDLKEIIHAANRAASLTRQLLAFSRRQVLEPRVVNVNSIMESMHNMFQRLIGEDIEFVSHQAPNLWNVKADPSRIEQVIANLVINARDAMPKGGRLTIETANVELDGHYAQTHAGVQPGPHVMLAVTDTGVGMDKKTQAHIFEPFFTTKEAGKGTGLGLSTVYGIVKQSGGHIWVYSEPGRGSSFKIYFPKVQEEPAVAAEEERVSVPSNGTETILLVEDEDAVRRLAERVLTEKGYKVLAASDAEQAQKILKERAGPVDLAVIDLILPGGMDGIDLARSLERIFPDKVKILFMSGYTDRAVFQQKVLGPQDHFLQKPFTPDLLVRKVREVLDTPPEHKVAPPETKR